jgi:PqqD family protein of HPr-rel-A system
MPKLRWRIAQGQTLRFEEFEDGVVMYDALVGGTHLLNITAAEALAVVAAVPDLDAEAIHARLCERLEVTADVLPIAAIVELLRRLEDLRLIAASEA